MPTALTTGATGLLGRQVLKAFEDADWHAVGTGFSRASGAIRKVDITDSGSVAALFNQVKPDVVVHCAADRQPDSCTKNPAAARALNVTATQTLVEAFHGSLFIYISTDYVFPGAAGDAPYKPTDAPNPTNIYGQTKADGENVVLAHGPNAVVLRVPLLYGPGENSESAVNTLMDALYKTGGTVKMDDWALRYPTNTEDVARVCVDLARKRIDQKEQSAIAIPHILQFSSEDKMTKYEICQKFSEIMGLPMDHIVPDKDGGKPKDGTMRPYDTHMDTSGLKDLGVDVSTVDFVAWWRRYVGAFRH
ncbi:dTDP-4-dehydrorhamnose reductase [Exophiala spinifera]|uniref:dTDP-4-dehydrorhamnose reductase n=1 Tax=Exophiala spinifera TaxID=91928 RepID=A0A0D2B3S8_9EURO|nr:dTDP-4-dehydrorhamnose reductase [Exophiala spinifera]KIW13335.1 dTDP-4-dehydrorhamnose reductase [Exophiala spinifera]